MDHGSAAARVAGLKPRTAREERTAAISLAFVLAEAAYRVAGLDDGRTAVLRKKRRKDKGRSEWALMDSKGERVLKWFGPEKPSEERVEKEERRIQYFKHKGSSGSDGDVSAVTFKSAPEYASIEDFVQYMMDDDRSEYDHEDLKALNYRLRKPLHEIKSELESYGLKLKHRESEKKGRGFQSPDHDRWFGPGSDPTHGGGGSGSKWVPSAI